MNHPILQNVLFSVYIKWPDGYVENRSGFPTIEAAQEHIDKYELANASIMEWFPMFDVHI